MRKQTVTNGSFALSRGRSATNRTPRQINRQYIFDLVRQWQPVSRADIARHSGLQRSTVSGIIEELIDEEWLLEGASGTLPRGRRPVLIQLHPSRGVLALDIHPSRTTIAFVDLSGKILAQDVSLPPKQHKGTITTICKGIARFLSEHKENSCVGIGICLPGRIDPKSEEAIFAPRLDWPVAKLKARMEQTTGLPVEMENVANACALAQVWFGESVADDSLVVVNVSEGISVGMFLNGKILRGLRGMAGEFGHVQLDPESKVLCACGNFGCWETLASNTSALRYHREIAGKKAADTYDFLIEAALKGDASAIEAISRSAVQLGRGIRILLSGLAPREVVIVGEIAAAWNLVQPLVEAEMRRGCLAKLPDPRCMEDGNGSRLRAAAALILSEVSV
jgi:predicted NBD/HSP70 family sugar kinase